MIGVNKRTSVSATRIDGTLFKLCSAFVQAYNKFRSSRLIKTYSYFGFERDGSVVY